MNAVRCVHPLINPVDKAGLYEAIRLYWGALENCNAQNGFPLASEPPTASTVAPTKASQPGTKTVIQKVTERVVSPPAAPLPTPIEAIQGK